MEEKKRKGYKTSKQQVAANKRLEERNPDAKERNKASRLKSTAKRFIKVYANAEDVKEFEKILKEKKGEIKMLENLKKLISEKADSIGELVNLVESTVNALEVEKIEAGIYKIYCENNIVIGLEIETRQDEKALAEGNDVKYYTITDIYQYKF